MQYVILALAAIAAAAYLTRNQPGDLRPGQWITIDGARYNVASAKRPDGTYYLTARPGGPRDPTPADTTVLHIYDPATGRITGTVPLGEPAPTTQEDGTPLL